MWLLKVLVTRNHFLINYRLLDYFLKRKNTLYSFCLCIQCSLFIWLSSTCLFVLQITGVNFPYQYDRDRPDSLPGLARNVLCMFFHISEDSWHGVIVMRGCHRLNFIYFWGLFCLFLLDFFQLILEFAPFLGMVWLFSQCLCGAERSVSVPLPFLGWSFSAWGMHSLEKSQPEPWWPQQNPGMASSGSHTSRQGRGEGSSWNPLCYSWPLSSIHFISSPLGSHGASEMHQCHHRGLARNALSWGWGTEATSPVCWCQVLKYILLPNNFLFPAACVSSREILVVQALLEDEYAHQSVCPVILPKPLGRFFVLHLDIGTGPLGLLLSLPGEIKPNFSQPASYDHTPLVSPLGGVC